MCSVLVEFCRGAITILILYCLPHILCISYPLNTFPTQDARMAAFTLSQN